MAYIGLSAGCLTNDKYARDGSYCHLGGHHHHHRHHHYLSVTPTTLATLLPTVSLHVDTLLS